MQETKSRLRVWLSPDDYCEVLEACLAQDLTVSGFVRLAIKKELGLRMNPEDNPHKRRLRGFRARCRRGLAAVGRWLVRKFG
jgi:hypothetical protein